MALEGPGCEGESALGLQQFWVYPIPFENRRLYPPALNPTISLQGSQFGVALSWKIRDYTVFELMNLAKGRIRRLLAKLPIILLGIVLGTGISELLLRLAGYSFPEFYQLDQLRGYALRPGMEGWYRKEGEASLG